jgi:N-methylhydantoinase A
MSFFIGVDTGGTFTDIVVLDERGHTTFDKAFSTPDAPENGILAALDNVSGRLGLSVTELLQRTARFAHGTTVATNALIQRRGARVGLLISRGFEDTLEIARGPLGRSGGVTYLQARDYIYTEPPERLVPRELVRGVEERIDRDGQVLVKLSRDQVRAVIRDLVSAGIDSLAVCLLWSFRNDAHERAVRDIASEVAPGLPVSLSCEIAPLMGEFERAMTTVVNAYVGPVTERYIAALQRKLRELGLGCPVQVMKSSGGLTLADQIASQSVAVVNSGPVGGLVGSRFLGVQLDRPNMLATDMGGTSFDVGLIADGEYARDEEPYLSHAVPVHVPAVRVVAIGAGGGSIAWTDGRRLQVGPQSAGAVPGPACYGLGGTQPTVTDALLLLGILDPETFFGGRRRLDPDLAERAIQEHVAGPLEMECHAAAAGIYDIVTAKMSDLIRKATIESGHDPREFTLLSYGGAGPAHCALFARALGVREVIVPHTASVFSAFGIALSDVLFTYARSEPLTLRDEAAARTTVIAVFRDLAQRARGDLEASGLDPAQARYRYLLDLRYVGQMNEVTIGWDDASFGPGALEEIRRRFEALYQARFGHGTTRGDAPLEVISLRLEALKPTEKPRLVPQPAPERGAPPPRTSRRLYLRERGWTEGSIFDFTDLRPGHRITGPAIVERADTTILVPAATHAWIDGYLNVRIRQEVSA